MLKKQIPTTLGILITLFIVGVVGVNILPLNQENEKKSLSLLFPEKGEAVMLGTTYTVRWKSTGIDEVDVFILSPVPMLVCDPIPGAKCAPPCGKRDYIAKNINASQGQIDWTPEELYTDSTIYVVEKVNSVFEECLRDFANNIKAYKEEIQPMEMHKDTIYKEDLIDFANNIKVNEDIEEKLRELYDGELKELLVELIYLKMIQAERNYGINFSEITAIEVEDFGSSFRIVYYRDNTSIYGIDIDKEEMEVIESGVLG